MVTESSGVNSTLYKYRNWGDDYHKDILKKNNIYFASIDQINDPYDCKLPLRYDLRTDDDYRKAFENHFSHTSPSSNKKQISDMVDEVMSDGRYKSEKSSQVCIDNHKAAKEKGIGLFSTSYLCDNMLMWSHYANSHTGFCVGFDKGRLEKFIEKYNNVFSQQPNDIELRGVEYFSEIPTLIPKENLLKDELFRILNIKWNVWEYEKEIRLLLCKRWDKILSKTDRILTLDPGIISEVILGSAISKEHKDEIIQVLREKHRGVTLKKIVREEDKFQLRCKPITY